MNLNLFRYIIRLPSGIETVKALHERQCKCMEKSSIYNKQKDQKKGKATLISLLGYKNAINYSYKLKNNIFKRLSKFGKNAEDLKETVNFILTRSK